MSDEIGKFCAWFKTEAGRLRGLSLDAAADEILSALKKIDAGLALEMADHGQLRELVVTALGNPELFDVVRRIKSRLGTVVSWMITALKPARGFDFVLTTPEGGRVEASQLFFESLETNESPPRMVIRVFLPSKTVAHPDIEWQLRVAVEAGIGEEACSHIAFFEAAPMESAPSDPLPIEVLGDFVAHVLKVNRQ
jgi:hypothetical protein